MKQKQFLVLVLGLLALISSLSGTALATNPHLLALSKGTVKQFTGTEHISQPFAFNINLTVPHPALNFANVVGQPLTVTVAKGRRVSGMIGSIEQLGASGRQGQYHVRLVPTLKRLSYRTTSRTFAELHSLQIVNIVLDQGGIPGLEIRTNGTLNPQEISVQYQESDLAFLSRLLEKDGIHYHFEPSASGLKTVLGDSNAAFPVLSPGQLVFGAQKGPSITSFSRGLSLHSGRIQAGDFNWRAPQVNLTTTAQTPLFQDLVEGVFPALVNTLQDSQKYSTTRLGARVTEGQSCGGTSTHPHMQAGYRFSLAGHPRKDFNQEYVITSVEHHRSRKGYRNTFTCLPSQIAFRPSPITPQPKIAGVLPGIVVGPQGEVKHVDEFGRVRVRFPWRNPAFSNSSDFGDSGWVRVAQIATGIGNSALWLPEVGDEVVIAFEHGDPHRPVVIGSVYNANNPPPTQLPDNKTHTLIRSRSIPGGNIPLELLMEAKAGQEHLTLRAGSQFIRISPNEISTSSTIKSSSPTKRTLRSPSKSTSPSIRQLPKRK